MPVLKTKPAWASKTYWGWLTMILGYVLGTDFDISAIADFGAETLEFGVFSVGTLLVAVGRATANVQVKLWPSKEGG